MADTAVEQPTGAHVDPIECSLGISTYLSPQVPGVSAVSKARYSDFLVHEVGLDQTVARLDSVEPVIKTDGVPAVATADAKNEAPAKDSPLAGSKRKNPPTSTDNEVAFDWSDDSIQSELKELVGEQEALDVVQFLRKAPDESNKFIRLGPLAEKDKRRNLHQWIRQRLDPIAKADTDNGAVRIWHKQFEEDMPNYGKFDRSNSRQQQVRPPRGKKFLRFVLYKENMDTSVAIGQIQRRFGGGKRKIRVGHAGMKDKRGVTSQFVTVPANTPISALCSLNGSGTGGGHTKNAGVGVIRVGDFTFTSDELQLGRLQGNRFDIVLRNVQTDPSDDKAKARSKVEQAAESLRHFGFINYFGVQRFGKFHDTHKTGIAILKGNFEEAINIIMGPKPDEREQVAKARKDWLERFQSNPADRAAAERDCAKRVVRDFNRFMQNEVAILNSLARFPLDYKRAFSCIPRTMRMMFIHALQSYLWNHVASYRINKLGHAVIVGDLVLANGGSQQGSGMPEVSVITADDVASDRYKLEDLVLPLVGSSTKDPENECSNLFGELLEKEGLTREMLRRLDFRDINCPGDYRKVICHPSDVEYQVKEYGDPLEPLLETDLMKLNGIVVEPAVEDVKEPLVALIVGFTLPSSSYATVALRELLKRPTSSEYQGKLDVGNRA